MQGDTVKIGGSESCLTTYTAMKPEINTEAAETVQTGIDQAVAQERLVRCFLDDPDMPQCCCNCSLHIEICKPWTNCGNPPGGCDCGTRKEWGCAAFLPEGKIIGDWPEHSCGCEMYSPNVKVRHGAEDADLD